MSNGTPLAELTTLRLGGPARSLVEADSAAALVDTVRSADERGEPVLLVGGGSNLVVADAGWPGTAVLLRSRGVAVAAAGETRTLTVEAGEAWDALVARTVAEGWAGLEALSGIPGLVGATPVQNVGAYGQEVADTITRVDAYDRAAGVVRELAPADCRFAYRDSLFKHTDRYVVLRVEFTLTAAAKSTPRYPELVRAVGEIAPLADVRDAVLALRRSKGMVVDAADPDTWSAGSFFTNPLLDPAALAAFEARLAPGTTYPSWPAEGGARKLSAAWLIQHAGFDKGHGTGAVRISTKHTLALTNRGGGTAAELVALAREVRDGVADRFGITLRPEPRLVGLSL